MFLFRIAPKTQPVGFRFYQLVINEANDPNSPFSLVSNFGLYTSDNGTGPNLLTGIVPSRSCPSGDAGFSATQLEKVFSGHPLRFYNSFGCQYPGTVTLTFDLGAPIAVQTATLSNDHNFPGSEPGVFSIRGSNDGIIYTTLGGVNTNNPDTWVPYETRRYSLTGSPVAPIVFSSVPYRYYRFLGMQPADGGGYMSLNNLGLYESGDTTGVNLAVGKPRTMYGNTGPIGTAEVYQDPTTSGAEFGIAWTSPEIWCMDFDLETSIQVNSISLTPQRVIPNRAPLEFSLQARDSMSSGWNTVCTYSNQTNWLEGERRGYRILAS